MLSRRNMILSAAALAAGASTLNGAEDRPALPALGSRAVLRPVFAPTVHCASPHSRLFLPDGTRAISGANRKVTSSLDRYLDRPVSPHDLRATNASRPAMERARVF